MTGNRSCNKRQRESRSISPIRKRIRTENSAGEDNPSSSPPRSSESQTVAAFRFSVPSPIMEFDRDISVVPYHNIQLSSLLPMWEMSRTAMPPFSQLPDNGASQTPATVTLDNMDGRMSAPCPETASTPTEEAPQAGHDILRPVLSEQSDVDGRESRQEASGVQAGECGPETDLVSVEGSEQENPTEGGTEDVVEVIDLCGDDIEVAVVSHGIVENGVSTVEVVDLCSDSEEDESDEEQYCTF